MNWLKIEFYVPIDHCESVKRAMFAAGAGRENESSHYDRCAWQTEGVGQFRPLSGSQPAIGKLMVEATVKEFKVEMIVPASCLQTVLAAMKKAHPYEQPAYYVMETMNV